MKLQNSTYPLSSSMRSISRQSLQQQVQEKAKKVQAIKDKIKSRREERLKQEKIDEIKREKERRERGQKIDETMEERQRLQRKREAERLKKEKEVGFDIQFD